MKQLDYIILRQPTAIYVMSYSDSLFEDLQNKGELRNVTLVKAHNNSAALDEYLENIRREERAKYYTLLRRIHELELKSSNETKDFIQLAEDVHKTMILTALTKCGGRAAKTADYLGIDRRTLYRWLKNYNLNLESEE